MNKITEQYNRVKRWYKKFQEIDEGFRQYQNSEYYVDNVYAFFINCHHLRDWIKNINGTENTENKNHWNKIFDDFEKKNECFKICKEICHAAKHLELNPDRNKTDPKFTGKAFSYDVYNQELKIKFNIKTNSGRFDAFELATDCMECWKDFFENNDELLID